MLGLDRLTPARCGAALAAPATLNRLELSNSKTSRCHKRTHDPAASEQCLLTMGTRCLTKHAREVVLDLDAMGHLVRGTQEGRYFSAYCDGYCYLPRYVFCGAVPLWAPRRTAAEAGAAGCTQSPDRRRDDAGCDALAGGGLAAGSQSIGGGTGSAGTLAGSAH